MEWSTVLTGIFGVTTILATAVAGLVWGTVKTLRDTAADLRGRVGDLEAARYLDKSRIAELETANGVLTKTVTGEVHWVALMHLLKLHHEESSTDMKRAIDLLIRVLNALNQGDKTHGGRHEP